MGNKRHLVLVVLCLAFAQGCSTLPRPESGSDRGSPSTDAQPNVRSTNRAEVRPVYILPVIESAWVNPGGQGDTWTSGYETATVVQPGRFATQEEAELMGLPYIVPGENTIPIVPEPVQRNRPAQELNATTVAQDLAALARENATSLQNQSRRSPSPVPAATPEPQPTPRPDISPSASPEPSPSTSSNTPPRVSYAPTAKNLLVYPGGGPGTSFSVPTPLGTAILTYRADLLIVEMGGVTTTVPAPTSGPAKIPAAVFGL